MDKYKNYIALRAFISLIFSVPFGLPALVMLIALLQGDYPLTDVVTPEVYYFGMVMGLCLPQVLGLWLAQKILGYGPTTSRDNYTSIIETEHIYSGELLIQKLIPLVYIPWNILVIIRYIVHFLHIQIFGTKLSNTMTIFPLNSEDIDRFGEGVGEFKYHFIGTLRVFMYSANAWAIPILLLLGVAFPIDLHTMWIICIYLIIIEYTLDICVWIIERIHNVQI